MADAVHERILLEGQGFTRRKRSQTLSFSLSGDSRTGCNRLRGVAPGCASLLPRVCATRAMISWSYPGIDRDDAAMRRNFTDKFVRSRKPAPPGKRVEHWDTKALCFGVRVTDRGHKTFFLYLRWPGARWAARREIGNADRLPPEAARRVARVAGQGRAGRRPAGGAVGHRGRKAGSRAARSRQRLRGRRGALVRYHPGAASRGRGRDRRGRSSTSASASGSFPPAA